MQLMARKPRSDAPTGFRGGAGGQQSCIPRQPLSQVRMMAKSALGRSYRGRIIRYSSVSQDWVSRYIDPFLGSSVSSHRKGTPVFGISGTSGTTAMKTLYSIASHGLRTNRPQTSFFCASNR
jgi:hypothetical protein